jgi:hypothetical protein
MAHPNLVRLLVAASAAGALALGLAGFSWPLLPLGTLGFWFAVTLLSECQWVRTVPGQATISMASAAHLAVAVLLPRSEAMFLTGLCSVLSETLVLRKPPVRVVFNASQAALAVGLASVAFQALPGSNVTVGIAIADRPWALLFPAAVYWLVNTGLVSLVIGAQGGLPPQRVWRDNFGSAYELFSNSTLIALGLILALLAKPEGTLAALLILLPILVVKDGYARYLSSLTSTCELEAPVKLPRAS